MFEFDPFDYKTQDDPYPSYQRLRDEAPAYFCEKYGVWILSRYDDCVAALRDWKTYCNRYGQTLEPTGEGQLPILLTMDPPEHTRLRKVVARVLTPEKVMALENDVRDLAVKLLEPFRKTGRIDIVADFSAYLPMAIIARMLHIPEEDETWIRHQCDLCVHRDEGVFRMPQAGIDATMKLYAYNEELIRKRREKPEGQDLLSLILQAEDKGEMNHDEVLGFIYLLAIAGNETTTKMIGNMAYQLSENPDQRDRLVADPSLIPAAVEETMRFDGPTQLQARTLTADVTLHGQTMKAGTKIGILFISANRDERHYPNADRFDISRNPKDHLGFGGGIHACLGAALARLEARIAFEEILKIMPDFKVDKGGLKRMHSPNVRGYTHVPVTFTPKA